MTEGYEQYLKNLPVMPDVAARILAMREESPEVSLKKLEETVKLDPGLTAKILKIANSALYARPREIKSLQTAITLLGFKNIKSLVILLSASGAFARMAREKFYAFFWRHSLLSAFYARQVTVRCGRKELSEECFVGGLLHDIGQVAFLHTDRERYREVVDQLMAGNSAVEGLEETLFGFNHHTFGSALLQKWNFPQVYIDIAREHRSLNVSSPHRQPVLIVTAATLLAQTPLEEAADRERQEMLAQVLPRVGLGAADAEYLLRQFAADLQNDPLYQECGALFASA